MDWASALSAGLSAGAKAGVDIIDTRMKADAQASAEQRAADTKLDTASRMLAIEDAMKTRAAERFSGVVKDQMGGTVPVEAEPVAKTGLTRDSAVAADPEAGTPGANFQQSPDQIKQIMARAQATVNNPAATDSQREDARGLMAALTAQMASQQELNDKAAEGKTRPRTSDEAQKAALDYTLQNDAPAFIAGTGMLNSANKDDLADRRLAQQALIAKTESDRKERSDNLRHDDAMARLDALTEKGSGKNGQPSALRQNVDLLKELGYGPDKIEKFIFDKKEISAEDIAAKLLGSDKFGEMTPELAMAKAMAIKNAAKTAPAEGAAGPKKLTYDPATGKFK